MKKHDLEQVHAGNARLREFTRQERESGVHPYIAALRSRPKDRPADGRKLSEYTRIERGYET
ncbi:hypothetical protein [Paracoccus fistulariae]|uniref:Uncharacterized protein n=1 Tax=Paracoccus fistulariae TaxID=658446 RepID=A0ABY7SKQ3_9RHOB|nr:hypothetical protein [Paracoccus fistulariae]MDB6181268.1 hypothetical protein [Paracoccus fistulariae]WCR06546.1 hypothetical protein JHX87_13785 [Paracoccus fistulariae]